MFERAFLNRPNEFRVLHEPAGDAWYFGPQRAAPRYSEEELLAYPQFKDSTYLSVWNEITSDPTGEAHRRTFVKDMAQYYMPPVKPAPTAPSLPEADKGNPTYIPEDLLIRDDVIFTFLIRTPAKAAPSYYRLCTGDQCEVTGFKYFDKSEMGLRELRIMYEYLVAARHRRGVGTADGSDLVLIDSEDLINAPEKYMQHYCKAVGVDFDPDMLVWEPGVQEHFKKWAGFHTDAENSTGIKRDRKSTVEQRQDWPQEVQEAISENMDDYNWLYERRLKL